MKRRPRIALFGKGIVGGGVLGQGVPVLRNLAEGLCREFDVVLYPFMAVGSGKVPGDLTIRRSSDKKIPLRLRSLLTLLTFLKDHLQHPFSAILAVSTIPVGRFAVWMGRTCRLPVIVILTTEELVAMPEIGYGELLSPRLKKINLFVCSHATEIVVLSEFQKQIAIRNVAPIRPLHVIPLMIDAGKFLYRERSISSPVKFLHIAYFHPVKDQWTLFRAFAEISKTVEARLTVVGDGFNVPAVQQTLSDLGISEKVILAGAILNDKLDPFFLDAHILLHTSRYESQGAVVLEAMASGVPVCGTSVGIISDLGDQYTVSAPVGDAQTLAHNTLELINDPARYRQMQKKGREFVVEHPIEWTSNQFVGILKKLIAGSGH